MLVTGLTMDGRDGEQIQSVHDMIGRFTTELLGKLEPWRDVLRDNPADLETIETSVHRHQDQLSVNLMD